MYQSSPSPSSHNSVGPSELTRYGSAPSSFLTAAVESVVGSSHRNPNLVGRYFSADSSCLTSESTCKVSSLNNPQNSEAAPSGSYGAGSSSLVRQRSSPAGFVSQVAAENGFSITRGTPDYSSKGDGLGISRLKSQLSFTGQDSLTQVSHVSENLDGVSSSSSHQNAAHSFAAAAGFTMESWDNANSISFSAPQSKHAKYIDGDIFNSINSLETQFSMPQTTLEMATMDKLMNIPEDSVPCKIRAKRGCATHPRSIAERERRIRISGKLKKLQELVPNMDKQTSYADMLDLAVKHIKGLQNEVKKLHNELQNCTCGCKPSS